MKKRALCAQCGEFKRSYLDQCPNCSFVPKLEIDVAKARILDFPYTFAVGTEGDVLETGRSINELKTISKSIKSGTPYQFPEEELDGMIQVYREYQKITPSSLIWVSVKWLAPPIALGLFFLIFFIWGK